MKSIIIDSSDKVLVVVAKNGDKIYNHIGNADAKRHTSEILVAIDKATREVGFNISQVESIGIVVGPGSFTGIRIGVSTAIAISRATGAKIISLTSLEIPAFGMNEVVSLLDCKHGYYALDRRNGVDGYSAISYEEAENIAVKKVFVTEASPESLLNVFTDKAEKGEYTDNVKPFYIKESSAESSAKQI